MAKKKNDTVEELKSAAGKVWLAGLGALAEAEEQGDKLFKSLVKKGKHYENLLPVASDAVWSSVEAAKKRAGKTWTDVESVLDRQVERAMKRVGVASTSEVEALRKDVARLEKLAKARKSGAGKKTRKPAARKKSANRN